MASAFKRKEFTEGQRAEIFARDRATCVYSGKSLWLLDYGASPLFDWNWVDHIKPSRRGGKANLLNGVCSSHRYNMKKRANGADNFMLLEHEDSPGGRPSANYFFYYGQLDPRLADQLIRLASIEPNDWYFNQAVCHLMLACYHTVCRVRHKRTPSYWVNSAAKKLEQFRAGGGTAKSLQRRGLVQHPYCRDVKILLSLASEVSPPEFRHHVKTLKEIYAVNNDAMNSFWSQDEVDGLRREFRKSAKLHDVAPAVLEAMKSFLDFWVRDPRR